MGHAGRYAAQGRAECDAVRRRRRRRGLNEAGNEGIADLTRYDELIQVHELLTDAAHPVARLRELEHRRRMSLSTGVEDADIHRPRGDEAVL